jgi:hypothetical protein
MSAEEQAFNLGRAWETIPEPKLQFILQVVRQDCGVSTFRIGPHTPSMKNEDVLMVHRLWLNITREPGLAGLHHHEILTEAVARFARDCTGTAREGILEDLRRLDGRHDTLSKLITTGVEPVSQLPAATPEPDERCEPPK